MVRVTAVNDAPAGTDQDVTINEDTTLTLTAASFGFTDVDAGDALDSVKITQRETARDALINGRWDAIGELIDGLPAVKATAAKLPYMAA